MSCRFDGAQVARVSSSYHWPSRTSRQRDLLTEDDASRGPAVAAVHASPTHKFSKESQNSITLLAGLGVQADAHCGATVQHRYAMRRDPTKPNLRQVHLLQSELLIELGEMGFRVGPGDLGENVTTRGLDILGLPVDTLLRLGSAAIIQLTGLRQPCVYIERFQTGLLAAVQERSPDGGQHRRAGVMGVVLQSGVVRPGDAIEVELPEGRHVALKPV